MKLLYKTAEWHGFAKLRMHTESTLEHLDALTKEFGLLMRQFRDLSCAEFQTVELPREVDARNRQRQRAQAKQLFPQQPGARGSTAANATNNQPSVATPDSAPPPCPSDVIIPEPSTNAQPAPSDGNTTVMPAAAPSAPASTGRKPKTLNLLTPKFHALGDYVRTIRLFGGTDSFSTQLVSDL